MRDAAKHARSGIEHLVIIGRLGGIGRASLAAKLRAEGKMSLSFVEELRAQVERLEEKILEAEAAGKDSGGDRVALSHLKALIEHLRTSEKSPGARERWEGD